MSAAAFGDAALFDRSPPIFALDREGTSDRVVLEPNFVASGGGSPSNAHDGESSLNGHFPQHLWASVEDLPQRWKVVVYVCHNLKTIDKDATTREAEANPAGSEASRL